MIPRKNIPVKSCTPYPHALRSALAIFVLILWSHLHLSSLNFFSHLIFTNFTYSLNPFTSQKLANSTISSDPCLKLYNSSIRDPYQMSTSSSPSTSMQHSSELLSSSVRDMISFHFLPMSRVTLYYMTISC